MSSTDTNILSKSIHEDPDCISSAAVENALYIKRFHLGEQMDSLRTNLAYLEEEYNKADQEWVIASANTKAAIENVIKKTLQPVA